MTNPPLVKKHEFILAVSALGVWLLRWPLIQVVAWVCMLVRYSFQHGIQRGVEMTFGGDHPCALCGMARVGMENDIAVLDSPLGFTLIALALGSGAFASLISRHLIRCIDDGN